MARKIVVLRAILRARSLYSFASPTPATPRNSKAVPGGLIGAGAR